MLGALDPCSNRGSSRGLPSGGIVLRGSLPQRQVALESMAAPCWVLGKPAAVAFCMKPDLAEVFRASPQDRNEEHQQMRQEAAGDREAVLAEEGVQGTQDARLICGTPAKKAGPH